MKEINLPDFEDMYSMIEAIRALSIEVAALKSEIEDKEGNITRVATEDEEFYVNGKPPSVAYISRAFIHSGFGGELLPIREELSEKEAELEYYKMKLDLDKIVIDVWRTESANKRLAID